MREHRSPLALGILLALVIVGVQALLVALFAAPAANIAPRDLPIAVAGPPPATQQLTDRLSAEHPGAFEIIQVADAAALDAAIRDREVYGGIAVTPAGAEVHVASAGSPAVSTLLSQASAGLQARVIDVVPLHSGDPRGSGFAAGFLPLAMTALLAGVLIFLLVPSRGGRLTALLTYAVASGFGGAAVLQYWLDILPGDYLANAGVLALFGLAVAATLTGLAAVLDRPGLALGVLAVFLVGNALAAVAAAPQLLPQPWGEVGQWLPIGSGATLLRSVAYFDGNGGQMAMIVLGSYAVAGLLLVAVGRRRLRARPAGPAAAPAREPALAA